MITFNDFQKLEIKIGTVASVEKVEGADKLLKFIFDLGDEKRQILAGLAPFFDNLDELVGKQMPILVNLEPKKMMGLESQGMILIADAKDAPVLLHPTKKIPAGTIVR